MKEVEKFRKAEHELSDAYLRIRKLVDACEEFDRNWPEWAKDDKDWSRFRDEFSKVAKSLKSATPGHSPEGE